MSAGEQVSQGYRQLAAVGTASGPDTKTVLCVGFGVVFGILAGTMLADGSWREMTSHIPHPTAQVAQTSSAAVNRPAAAAQIATAQVQMDAPAPEAPKSLAAVQTLATQALVATSSPAAQGLPIAQQLAGAHTAATAHRAISTHKHRFARRLASWRRHLFRHRLPVQPAPELAASPLDEPISPKRAVISPVSAFMIEGEVTVSSYDAAAGTIETFEGESFSLDKSLIASNEPRGSDVPANIHYRCDQFWSCSLFVAGQLVPNAKRTR